MLDRLRSSSFKSALLLFVGIILIVFQIVIYRFMRDAGDSFEYGTDIRSFFVFIGYWIYIFVGVVSIITGLSMVYKHNNFFVKSNVIVLTIALGVLYLVAQMLCSLIVIYQADYFLYTLHDVCVDSLVAVFAALVCGPLSAIIVCLASPYYYFSKHLIDISTSQGSESVWFILTLAICFFVPVVFSHLTLLYLNHGKWKRLIISIVVSYFVSFFIYDSATFLKTLLFMQSIDPEFKVYLILTVVTLLVGIAIAVMARRLYKRYDKRHSITKGTSQTRSEINPSLTYESEDAKTNTPQPSIRFCRRCGAVLIEGSKFVATAGIELRRASNEVQ